ncbi:MAG: SbcC/MukB-like Walker B domain-containing protein, partial [Acetobacterium sp.]|nr:SbcC/MukB-like Walker B domain-containing protein [Acetobacterium sp.]
EELALGYLIRRTEAPLADQARELIQKNPQSEKQNKEQITLRLMEIFKDNSQYLREYAVNSQYVFEDQPLDEENDRYKQVWDLRRRMNITARVAGKVVNFYDLSDHLKDSLDETDKLLKESDRELFEDILVKNISKKISARIFHSEKWVDNMNKLMEKMDTSMGLSFSLKWASKKAETEEQLDTKKLVNLLKMDGNLLRDEDLAALSEHFRSKIALARRTLEDKGVNLTFHSIMRDILDYRKWFEFKLFFKKTGQLSKELTNNGFFKFSGGEKAMAMYVPLFSAVNARYEAAGKESARMLSLDEAFAGVDEQNIRDMFRLLNELDLSYIINSQILWGDYDTVDSLAISELIRPDNADFVTVLNYHWNGKLRRLVIDDA